MEWKKFIPKPSAPKLRLTKVEPHTGHRTGITVDASKRFGFLCWSAVKFHGDAVVERLTGNFDPVDLKGAPRLTGTALQDAVDHELQRQLAIAVIDLGVGVDYPVHRPLTTSASCGVHDALAELGIPVSSAAAPSAVRAAAAEALTQEGIAHLGEIKISTDASCGRTTTSGHGWFIESATMYRPVMGRTTSTQRTVRAAELYSILKALKAADRQFGREALRAGGLRVRSDCAIAVRMLREPGWLPESATSREIALATSIRDFTKNLRVRFVWVRGHNGDLGNETADRLAVAARRLHYARTPKDSAAAIIANICHEATERFQSERHRLAA